MEKIPGSEYGLNRRRDHQNKNSPVYRRYPSNIQWDPEDPRLAAMEIYLHQQRLDLSSLMSQDERTHDLLLTSRGAGFDSESTIGSTVGREGPSLNHEDSVSKIEQNRKKTKTKT